MRRTTGLIMLLMIISCHAHAQDNIVKHIIDRGETLASVARLYGTTTERLVELNPDASDFVYTGMELDVPYSQADLATASASPAIVAEAVSVRTAISEACKEADELLVQEEYSKAAKAYSKIIKAYKSSEYSCVDAYYGRALAYYNQSKWKSSIKDFECALADSRCTGSIRTHCTSLLATARKNREEQLERRGEMWGSLFVAAAAATTTALVANQQAKSSTNVGAYSSRGNNNLDYLLDPRYAAQQVNAQYEAEYQQARQFNPSLTREQFMQMKAQASQATQNASTNTSETSVSHTESYSHSSSATSKDCLKISNGKWYCVNTGKCAMCGGDGLMNGSFGQGANSLKCTLCNGTGKCPYCQH